MVKEETATCACTQKLLDLLRAAQPSKKSSLMKITCADCGKAFWSNLEKKYCFDCEPKHAEISHNKA